MSDSRSDEQKATNGTLSSGLRKVWHVPVLTRYPAGAAETVRATGAVDGGGGAHKDS